MKKMRYIDDKHDKQAKIIFRADNFKKQHIDDVVLFNDKFANMMCRNKFDCIIISDYNKGTLSKETIEKILERKDDCLIIVDSKRRDISIFNGADILNVNDQEYNNLEKYLQPEDFFDYVVTTRGGDGAVLSYDNGENDIEYEDFYTDWRSVVDVTGCGDTFTAALAVKLLETRNLKEAIQFANRAAGIAVSRFGTARISKWDFSI